MKPSRSSGAAPRALLCLGLAAFGLVLGHTAEPIRALVIVGGHDFQTNQFHELFQALPDVRVRIVEHPTAHAWLERERSADYDVLVLYDMWQPISEDAKANFTARLAEGKGLVALHHSLANYQDWEEYGRIIGGRYLLAKRTEDGIDKPASSYLHDVQFRVEIAAPNHPVTRGLPDFVIHDETYGQLDVRPDVHVLLKTKEATSNPVIAWSNDYRGARVACIQLGHDRFAYENPHYRQLLAQAIRWTAKRD
jgi:uncharacterized protein